MTKNPFVNALSATFYIIVVASMMYYGPQLVREQETIFVPVAMISLFTLSTAIMSFLFFYKPFQMYFAGEKKGALSLFLQTIVAFACFTALIFSLLLLQ